MMRPYGTASTVRAPASIANSPPRVRPLAVREKSFERHCIFRKDLSGCYHWIALVFENLSNKLSAVCLVEANSPKLRAFGAH